MAEIKIEIDELKKLKEVNDSVKDTIASLKSMARAYDSVLIKIDSMNKGTINTKKIQKELTDAEARQRAADSKFKEARAKADAKTNTSLSAYKKALQSVQEQEEKVKNAIISGNAIKVKQQSYLLDQKKKDLKNSRDGLTADAIKLVALEETARISEKITDDVKERLSQEKEIGKTLGTSGRMLEFVSKKTGLFKDSMAVAVEKAREGVAVNKWILAAGVGLYALKKAWDLLKFAVLTGIDLFKKGLNALIPEGAKNPLSGLVNTFSNLLTNIPLVGKFLAGLVDVLNDALTIILHVDDTIVKAGRSLNLNTREATALYHQYQQISGANNDIFVTSTKLLESRVELSKALGVNNSLSEETLATNIKLKDIAGIEAETLAQIAENKVISGKTSEGLVKSVLAQVVGLQRATGISLNYQKVLKEANALGGYLGLAFAKYPEKLTKSLVTTQALGTSLKQLDEMANSFLDFESSIGSEFEAQLLTGKELNLQTARRLFLQNDLAGAALEINRQVGSSEEYLNMNRVAAESLAKAFGMTRDTLGDMLKKQEFLSRIGAKDTDNAREQLRLAIEKYKTQENLVAAVGEETYQNMINASTQERIGAFLDKVKTTFIDFIENSGLIQKVEGFIKYLSSPENMQKMINNIKDIVATAVELIGNLTYYTLNALDYMSFGYAIDESFLDSIKSGTSRAVSNIRNSDIGSPLTVSGNMINNARRESEVSAAGFNKTTVINNNTNTVVGIEADGTRLTSVVLKNTKLPVVGDNPTNPTMREQNSGIG